MRPTSSSIVSADRTNPPSLLELPEEAIVAIISSIDRADNQTLSHLAQTCRDLWRLSSVDSLRSFFYAAHDAYELGDKDKKVAVFCMLTEWIHLVTDQLPEETQLQILEHLADMGGVPINDGNDLQKIIVAVKSLYEVVNIPSSINAANSELSNGSANSVTSFQVIMVYQKLNNLLAQLHEKLAAIINEESCKLLHLARQYI